MSETPVPDSNISHYRIVSKLGAGGMGEVYLAEDTRLDRQVAIKLLPSEFTQDAERVRRFMQEAKAASALNHPNIITVHDIGESDTGRFIVMELVAGRTLSAIIAEANSTAEGAGGAGGIAQRETTLLALGGQMAKALSAAHSAGITHRDIKPDNIMVRDDGYVKILDFGLARLLPTAASDAEAATLAQQTMPGTLMGTVAYMSPEQVRGQPLSPASDIFALGIVFYQLVTGQHPFKAETIVGYLHAITLQTPLPPATLKPEIFAALDALILRMLEKEASKRPAANEVAQALQEIERRGAGDTLPILMASAESPSASSANSGAGRAEEGFWVAVLPFKYRGANADLEALAEGLSEDIVIGLSRFSYLRVIARSSTLRYPSEAGDARGIGDQLGARYVMEGSLRQAGSVLRLAVQLVDASTGAHLWAETYNRTFSPEAVFELQDELVPRIVSTVADWYGVLPHSMSEAVRHKPPDQLSPYEAVLRSFGYYERITPEEHAAVRAGLERTVQQAPGNADGWAMLSMMYGEEHRFGFNAQPDSLGRSLHAARQAVDAAHANHFAWLALAQALFFRKEFDAFRDAAERAIALNPMDGSTVEYMSHLIAFSGDWERGCQLAERARLLNPNHPAWYWAVPFLDAYRKGDYRSARTFILRGNQQAHFFTHALFAALYGQLGEREAADKALREVLTLKPDFPLTVRADFGKWYLPELVEHVIDGLRKAGLEIAGKAETADALPAEHERKLSAIRHPATAIRRTVGREPERNELRAAFNGANAGRGSLLCVAGEPGIGKTTLVEDFLTELAAEGQCTIARGRCSERLAGTEAYLPLLEALESLLQSGSNPAIARVMKQIAPTWYAQIVPLSGDSEESARLLAEIKAASHERMKRELGAFLQEVARLRPLVLFFDDLHWADTSTIDLLSFLAGKFDVLSALIVVTYRPSDMLLVKHPFLQIKPDLQARGVCRELLLEFLTEAEIDEYLRLEFPRHSFPIEFCKLIHAKTEGSPLFMADLVRYLRDRNVIALDGSQWTLVQTLPDIERELPESVRGMIERKIAQLSEEDHKLLTVASVQGYEFDSAVVAQVLNLDADEIEERLEKLERVFAFVKLVSETEFPNRTLTLRYRFVHVLYQNALYALLRATRRATFSREVAQTMEGFYGERKASVANELAALYETGREFAKAADYFQLAAEHARQVFAEQEAVTLAGRGLEALKSLPDTPERAQQELALQVALGLALRTIKGFSNPETGKAYARARELCQQIGDAPQLFPVLFGLWEFYQSTAQLETALELGELLLAAAGQDPSLLLVAHNVMADQLTWLGSFVAAHEHLEKGIALYDSDQHRSNVFLYGYDSGVACLSFDSIVLWHLGYPDQALKMSDQACDLASKLSHPLNLAYAASFAAWFHSLIGSMQTAQEQADTGIAISDQYDIAMFLAWGKLMKGWALIGQGKIQEGIALASQGINEWRATGTLLATSWCLGILAQGNGKAGRTEESLALLAEALDFVSRTGEHFYEAELYRLRGELLLKLPAQHLPSEAEACFRLAIEIAQKQQAKSLELRARMSLARLCQRQSRTAEAHKMLAEVYSWFTEGFDTADLRDAKALLEELQQQSHKSVGFSLQAAELDTAEDRLKPELHAPPPSIAVLPFVNISTDPDNEYFCDGLAEEVLNALSKIEALRVVARTSSFSFKGKEIDIREIGQNLKVEAVLEGSVRKSGNRLRITAQLVNVADGYHLWSERYDRKMQDIFDIQDEISLAIVDALKVKLLGTEKAAVLKRYTDNMEAYQLYLKGRFHCSKWTAEGMKNAIELFEQAIVIEPDYAPAFAGLAACYVYLWLFNYLPPDESLPQMKAAAIRAMAIDPALAESHYAIARMKFWYEWKFQEAEREFKKGIELNPNYSEARERYGALLAAMDRYAEAVDEADRALDNDPLSFGTNYNVGWILCCAGQYDRMLEQGRKLIDLDASFYGGHILIGVESWANGEYDQAIAALLKAVSLGGGPLALSFLGCVYGIAGEQDKSRQLLEELQVLSARQYVLRCYFAMIYAGMGEMDRAFESLEQAYQQRDGILVLLKHIARFIPGLRGDPRFEDLLRRIGLPH